MVDAALSHPSSVPLAPFREGYELRTAKPVNQPCVTGSIRIFANDDIVDSKVAGHEPHFLYPIKELLHTVPDRFRILVWKTTGQVYPCRAIGTAGKISYEAKTHVGFNGAMKLWDMAPCFFA